MWKDSSFHQFYSCLEDLIYYFIYHWFDFLLENKLLQCYHCKKLQLNFTLLMEGPKYNKIKERPVICYSRRTNQEECDAFWLSVAINLVEEI